MPPTTFPVSNTMRGRGESMEFTKKRYGYIGAPKIGGFPLDSSVNVPVPRLSSLSSEYSGFSNISSFSLSPTSTRSSFPSLVSDDYPVRKTQDSLCDEFSALTFTARMSAPSLQTPNLRKPGQHDAARSHLPVTTRDQISSSRTIVVNLTYPDNPDATNRAPKIKIMEAKYPFQILLGILAQSLSVSPELVDLTIQQNSQMIRLSPIASPYQLGYSGELMVQVWIRNAATEDHPSLPGLSNQPRRIPGTIWIHSFPATKVRLGLPSNPKSSHRSVSI
ncbi:hypothetical protein PGT21_029928 [Puccinia graminis f. sp. tritici]|uniref:Uncharacterized protein n=1 Tax=Puccinia graminis f. sp. tritici TaxID=56615 RepID=A0A5B0MJE8_PUCGR|nr:hypothetical protein PGTUg99_028258 [Puccinia graminis f. sp. tritici]KAA1091274.1 hypothetical protein PGT21_029928 [Puccinia graminis f. sp. tritici]